MRNSFKIAVDSRRSRMDRGLASWPFSLEMLWVKGGDGRDVVSAQVRQYRWDSSRCAVPAAAVAVACRSVPLGSYKIVGQL